MQTTAGKERESCREVDTELSIVILPRPKKCAQRTRARELQRVPTPRIRRRKFEASLSSPATPPHHKRARHKLNCKDGHSPSLDCDTSTQSDDSGCDIHEDRKECLNCLSMYSPRGEESVEAPVRLLTKLFEGPTIGRGNTLLSAVMQFLTCTDLARLSTTSKIFYTDPMVWKTCCIQLRLLAPDYKPETISYQNEGSPRLDSPFFPEPIILSNDEKQSTLESPSRKIREAAYYRRAASLRSRELAFVPPGRGNLAWLEKNPCLRSRFFPILVNWLVDLHLEIFRLHASQRRTALAPVHTAVKYLYIFLSRVGGCQSQGLQRVGVACYALAVRRAFSESILRRIEVDDEKFAYFTDNAYTPQEIQQTTADVAKAIPDTPHFPPPTTLEALEALLRPSLMELEKKAQGIGQGVYDNLPKISMASNELIVAHAYYMVDLSIHEDNFARELPSCLAAASLLAAHEIVTGETTPPDDDARKLAAACCSKVTALTCLAKNLRRLFERARRRETRQTPPHRSVTASHYWTVIDRYRRRLLSIATGTSPPLTSGRRGLGRIRW